MSDRISSASVTNQPTLGGNDNILKKLKGILEDLLVKQRERAPDCGVFWHDDLRDELGKERLLQIFINCHGRKKIVDKVKPQGIARDGSQPPLSYIKIVAILILIGYTEWDQFENIFLKLPYDRARSDENLPFDQRTMQMGGFFRTCKDDRLVNNFYTQQYRFIPIIIQNPTLKEYSKLYYLPFISPEDKCGSGGFGDVFKRQIPQHYLPGWRSSPNAVNGQVVTVAVKMVRTERNWGKELTFFAELQRSINSTKHLVECFGTVLYNLHLYFIFPLASCDLNSFLGNHYEKLNQERRDSVDKFSYINDNGVLKRIFLQMAGIAHALKFLHCGDLRSEGRSYPCTHMDISTDNILVFASPRSDDIGVWKITDFGISKIEKESNKKYTITKRRQPCFWNAPEAEVPSDGDTARYGPEGDMWSFGVVMMLVLSFVLGENVTTIEDEIEGPSTNILYCYVVSGVGNQKRPDLNPQIITILERFRQKVTSRSHLWINCCVDLIWRQDSKDRRITAWDSVIPKTLKEHEPPTKSDINRGLLAINERERITAKTVAFKLDKLAVWLEAYNQSRNDTLNAPEQRAVEGVPKIIVSKASERWIRGAGVATISTLSSTGTARPTEHVKFFDMHDVLYDGPIQLDGLTSHTPNDFWQHPADINSPPGHWGVLGQDNLLAGAFKAVLSTFGNLLSFVAPSNIIVYQFTLLDKGRHAHSLGASMIDIGKSFRFPCLQDHNWVDTKIRNSLLVGVAEPVGQGTVTKKLLLYKFPSKSLTSFEKDITWNPNRTIKLLDLDDQMYSGFHIITDQQLVLVYRTRIVIISDLLGTLNSRHYEVKGTIDNFDWVSISTDGRRIGIFSRHWDDLDLPMHYTLLRAHPNAVYEELISMYCHKDMRLAKKSPPYSTHGGFVCHRACETMTTRSNIVLYNHKHHATQPWKFVCEDFDIMGTFALSDDSELYTLRKSDRGLVITRYLIVHGERIELPGQKSYDLGNVLSAGSDFTLIKQQNSPNCYFVIVQPCGIVGAIVLE